MLPGITRHTPQSLAHPYENECGFTRALRPDNPFPGYNLHMFLAVFLMRLLEILFFLGLAGSTIVVLISFIEDAKELFERD